MKAVLYNVIMEDPSINDDFDQEPESKGPKQLSPLETIAISTGIEVDQLKSEYTGRLHLFHPLRIHYEESPHLVHQDPDSLFEVASGISASGEPIVLRGFSTEYQRATETTPGKFHMSNVCTIQTDHKGEKYINITHGQENGDVEDVTLWANSIMFGIDAPGMMRSFFARYDRSTETGSFELKSLSVYVRENEISGSEVEYELERDKEGKLVAKEKFSRGRRSNWQSAFIESPFEFKLVEEEGKPRTITRKEGDKIIDVWEVPDIPEELINKVLPLDELCKDPTSPSTEKEKIWKNFRMNQLGIRWEQVENDAFDTMPLDRHGMSHWRYRW